MPGGKRHPAPGTVYRLLLFAGCLCLILVLAACAPLSSPVPTVTPSPVPTATATPSPVPTATATPSPVPTLTATPTPIAAIPIFTYRILNTYPHDPAAFTEGLVFYDGFLYEGTGLVGHSGLRRVDLETGEVLQSVPLAVPYFGEGIALLEGQILQLTWKSHVGFVYDRETFKRMRTFTYLTEGWGLTTDGERWIMSDGSATLHFLDRQTLREVSSVQVTDGSGPVAKLNELEYVKGEVLANVWQTDRITRIDPASGRVTGWIDLAGIVHTVVVTSKVDVLNGIAYDAENDRLFVTGKLWPWLFEIELVPSPE
jgi:glutamine cyclotransferase